MIVTNRVAAELYIVALLKKFLSTVSDLSTNFFPESYSFAGTNRDKIRVFFYLTNAPQNSFINRTKVLRFFLTHQNSETE